MWFNMVTQWYNCFDPTMKSWQLVVLAHSSQWCHQPFKWHTPVRRRHREGGSELGWAHKRNETWKMQPEHPFSSLESALWLWGSLGVEASSRVGAQNLIIILFKNLLKQAHPAKFLASATPMCPSRVWLNWKCMELRFFFVVDGSQQLPYYFTIWRFQ